MKLLSTCQINQNDLCENAFDIFIGASGYESRSTYAYTQLGANRFKSTIIFGFTDRINNQRKFNDSLFEASRSEIIPMAGNLCHNIREYLGARIEAINNDNARIYVDYTSMTRAWYAAVIEALVNIRCKSKIECVFSYSPAKFTVPLEASTNSVVGPLPGFCGLDVPDKPTALIIGLGYERDRSLGLFQYVDPAIAYAFYTDPVLDLRFLDLIRYNNLSYLSLLPKSNIFTHPLYDLQRTGDLLLTLCTSLRDDYRIILAPLGVKPFSLICMLLATRFRDIDVWRVSPGIKSPPQEREALGPLLLMKAEFS